MKFKLPIIYSAHHSSRNFGKYRNRINLNKEEIFRFSDYGTDKTVPRNGVLTITSTYSRGIVNLNRGSRSRFLFPVKDFGKPARNTIWKPGLELNQKERAQIYESYYLGYHKKIKDTLKSFTKPGIVVAWDNTSPFFYLEEDRNTLVNMKPIILSNRGAESTGDIDLKRKEKVTCSPELLLAVGRQFGIELKKRNLPNDIFYNWVYKGGYVARRYNTFRFPNLNKKVPISSFQVEYDTSITHDDLSLEPKPNAIKGLKEAFEVAIEKVYLEMF